MKYGHILHICKYSVIFNSVYIIRQIERLVPSITQVSIPSVHALVWISGNLLPCGIQLANYFSSILSSQNISRRSWEYILFLVCVRVGEKCRRRYPEMDLIAACRNFSFIFALVSCRGHFVCNVYTFSDIFSDKRIKEICLVSDRRAVMKRTKLSRSIWLMTYIALNLATNNIIFTKPITQYHFFVQNKYFRSYRIYFSYIIFKIFSYNHDDNNS